MRRTTAVTEQLHGWLLRFHSLLRRWHLRALVTNEAVRGWRDQLPQSAGRRRKLHILRDG
jgi:hypothetical protein